MGGLFSSTLSICKGAARRILPGALRDRLRVMLRKSPPQQEVFANIHRHNAWGDGESVSGPGSTLEYTASVRAALPALLRELNVQTMLDLPCGDFNWMSRVDLPAAHYIGADIVPDLIAENQRRHGGPHREFRVLDVAKDELPAVDLLMCRDCLMHLSVELVEAALGNILRSRIKYLLTTTHPEGKNRRIFTGEWFPINLEREPYHFPPPLRAITDWIPPYAPRHLSLWSVEELRQARARP